MKDEGERDTGDFNAEAQRRRNGVRAAAVPIKSPTHRTPNQSITSKTLLSYRRVLMLLIRMLRMFGCHEWGGMASGSLFVILIVIIILSHAADPKTCLSCGGVWRPVKIKITITSTITIMRITVLDVCLDARGRGAKRHAIPRRCRWLCRFFREDPILPLPPENMRGTCRASIGASCRPRRV